MNNTARDRLLKLHGNLCDEAFALMVKKGTDYASVNNPYSNFQMSEVIAGIPSEQGIMLRIGDKLARIKNFLITGNLSNESFEDSIIDIINYLILMKGMLDEELINTSNDLKENYNDLLVELKTDNDYSTEINRPKSKIDQIELLTNKGFTQKEAERIFINSLTTSKT